MYDTYGRMCPTHPTLAHPCQLCGEIERDVPNPAALPANTVVKGIDWKKETDIPYNTPRPRTPEKFNPSTRYFERNPEHAQEELPPPVPDWPRGL